MPSGVEEGIGLALAIGGILAGFKGAVDGYLLIESFFHSDDESGYSCLRYHIEKHKLIIWGDFFKVLGPDNSPLKTQPKVVKDLILLILGQIEKTHRKADKYVKKHDLTLPAVPPGNLDSNPMPGNYLARKVADLFSAKSADKKFSWTIKDKDGFSKIVSQLNQLNRDLYDMLKPSDAELLQAALASYVMPEIKNPGHLTMIQDQRAKSPKYVALSARLKNMEQSASTKADDTLKLIESSEIKLHESHWTTGLLKAQDGRSSISCWVEWHMIVPSLPSYDMDRTRIESLATMLQVIDEPDLRVPRCLGLIDDNEYEVKYKIERLGFVFTALGDDYEQNLRSFEPRTLKQLIRETQRSPPLLGDRFKLAYILASSFSRFHAAGWLHKGFCSRNIVFSQRSNGRGVSLTDPFVIGFQYSRSQTQRSLNLNTTQDPEEEYYFHPNATGGFTKILDLYSFGVVLCEIGHWGLLGDSVPKNQKRIWTTNRRLTQEIIQGRPLKDLGWRMGEMYRDVAEVLLKGELPDDDDYFSHEFFKKVIMPLGACSA